VVVVNGGCESEAELSQPVVVGASCDLPRHLHEGPGSWLKRTERTVGELAY